MEKKANARPEQLWTSGCNKKRLESCGIFAKFKGIKNSLFGCIIKLCLRNRGSAGCTINCRFKVAIDLSFFKQFKK
jgi:hypothetical protein